VEPTEKPPLSRLLSHFHHTQQKRGPTGGSSSNWHVVCNRCKTISRALTRAESLSGRISGNRICPEGGNGGDSRRVSEFIPPKPGRRGAVVHRTTVARNQGLVPRHAFVPDLLHTVDLITKAGAGFRSMTNAWADTTTPHGKLMLTVLGGLCERLERQTRCRKLCKPAAHHPRKAAGPPRASLDGPVGPGVAQGFPPGCKAAVRPSLGVLGAFR
jgi:hypothetical protein